MIDNRQETGVRAVQRRLGQVKKELLEALDTV